MSSTTDPTRERGQILVLFAGALATLLIVAALAFDVGLMLLERRDQQNAADAAALAGARYVLASGDYSGSCSGGSGNAAVRAACDLALANGFADADADEDVVVHIPPVHGIYAGFDGFIEVTINASRPSIFGGVIGRAVWPVGAYAVAGDQDGIAYSFGMLALNPTECKALQVAGTGVVNSASNIQSNSNGSGCGTGDPYGFSRSGAGTLNLDVTAVCRSTSLIQDVGSGSMTCSQQPNSFALPDPLRKLAAPSKPPAVVPPPDTGGTPALIPVAHADTPPDNCPGTLSTRKPFEETQRAACEVTKAWIFSPGLYPGGISVKGPSAVAYLLPGIYWIGGGGFSTSNDGSVISVAGGSTPSSLAACHASLASCDAAGGVLVYNSKLPTAAAGPINLGGGGATLKLLPYDYLFGDDAIDLVIFQDSDGVLGRQPEWEQRQRFLRTRDRLRAVRRGRRSTGRRACSPWTR